MTIDKSYLKHYFFSFKGRSTRAEWWLNHFIVIFGMLFSGIIDVEILNYAFIEYKGILVGGFVFLLIGIPLFCSNVSVVVRRWHDLNRSGWFYFFTYVPFLNLIAFIAESCVRGTKGPNRFGEDPKEEITSSEEASPGETTSDKEEITISEDASTGETTNDKEETVSSEEASSDNGNDSPEDKLTKLAELKEKGLIDEEDYNSKKEEILKTI